MSTDSLYEYTRKRIEKCEKTLKEITDFSDVLRSRVERACMVLSNFSRAIKEESQKSEKENLNTKDELFGNNL